MEQASDALSQPAMTRPRHWGILSLKYAVIAVQTNATA